jgi:molybdopterin-containing oxidoreductase family iron-sulfur binding subunit
MHVPLNSPLGEQQRQVENSRRELPMVSNADRNEFDRRDFLKLAGFAVAGATLTGCQRAAVQYAVSPLAAPEDYIPGMPAEYASTCGACSAGCGLLVKNRDGRPIKLEGNPDHPLSRGGLCAVGQASLLSVYDQQRLNGPLERGQPVAWQHIDQELVQRLDAIRTQKGAVRFLSGPGVGPATRAVLWRFLETFPNARHVVHDSRGCSAILEAHVRTHGARVLPHFHLDKADVIVGFDADFLGTWISPVEFAAAYQVGRNLEATPGRLSYHVQFESLLTLTGAKADERRCVAPGELATVMHQLSSRLANRAGIRAIGESEKQAVQLSPFLEHLADFLWQNRQRSLILCGSQDVELQVHANFLNHMLGNYGATLDIARPSYQRDGNDHELATLLEELHDGKVAAFFVIDTNPAHDLPGGEPLAEDLKRVPLIVSLAPRLDETARLAHFVCPDHNYLESWGDAEPVNGIVSLRQPVINPLGNTRSIMESLAAWMGKPRSAYELLREHWEKEVFPRNSEKVALPALASSTVGLMSLPSARGAFQAAAALPPARPSEITFAEFWNRTLEAGFTAVAPKPVAFAPFNLAAVRADRPASSGASQAEDAYSITLYTKVGMPDSCHAYNPWLHELPDPMTKVTWDNYACVSPATAAKLGLVDGDIIRLEVPAQSGIELPVLIQPGQHDRVVGVALGFGSVLSRRFGGIGPKWLQAGPTVGPNGLVGTNAAPLLRWAGNGLHFTRDGVRLSKAAGQHWLATTQSYDLLSLPPRFTQEGRERQPIIRETTLQAQKSGIRSQESGVKGEVDSSLTPDSRLLPPDLWPDDHPVRGSRWGMVIDLNACTGCSACVIACQAENNTPVVGKDEVRRQREMHWLRIDRYYTERDGGVDVAHQPMLCQHCGNAPCEVVCPVLATVHSEEGLNQQIYNRCVGTRYCANNCPYKVRRFNWFDYAHDDTLQNLALNPDVTVRSRGVMEKCTFCVQRIEEGRIAAGGHGQVPRDGVIQTACQQSCPSKAIAFGNLNDPASRVAKLVAGPRSYQVLAELNVRPSVSYLGLVRNRPASGEDVKKHG